MDKIRILFDVSVLALDGARERRTGIFFVVLNLLREMQNCKNISATLYFSPEKVYEGQKNCRKLQLKFPFFQHSNNVDLKLGKVRLNLFKFHRKFYSNLFLRKISAACILFLNIFFKCKFCLFKKDLSCYDVFLSPLDAIPAFIRKKNIQAGIILHDAIPLVLDYLGAQRRRSYEKLVKSFLPSDLFFGVSRHTLNDFSKFSKCLNSGNSFVCPLAANECYKSIVENDKIVYVKKKYGIPLEKKYVFSLCAIEPRKNLERALSCFLIFAQKNSIKDIVWALGGAAWDTFTELSKKFDSDLIIRTGYIDDEDLPVLYSNAEWFVYTSQYEGFGLPPLEAMQCGCPVITSNNSSLPEVVGDAGIMIDWDSDEQHVEAYEQYYFNEDLRKENSRKGLERAKLFSWKKTVEKMVETMKSRFFLNACKKNMSSENKLQ